MENDPQSTEQLIAQARAGDKTALAELRKRQEPKLRQAIAAGVNQLHLDHSTDDALDMTWHRIEEFKGERATELDDWLRDGVLKLLANEETIPPPPNRDLPTLANPSAADTIAPKPKAPDESNEERNTPSGDPSPITPRDADHGTDANRPTDPESTDPEATDPEATDPEATDPETTDPEATEIDALETVAPSKTIAKNPLATIADGGRAQVTEQPARQVFGDFEILETIAKGGMGVVYKARNRKLNRVVALKMILAGDSAHSEEIKRFLVEAEASAKLQNPNIVAIYQLGEVDGQHYISMQYVEGQSLADLVREYPLEPKVASKHMVAISEAMQYAHDNGVLHRDLKPGNILVDRANVPLITDFGLAKLNPSNASEDEQARANQSSMTIAGQPMGTPSFMPPEQARGSTDEISELSDVYSLGATLYHLLTGKPPFAGVDVFKTMEQVLKEEPVSPRVVNASVPKDLETICLKCLQKSPDRRYQSAQELADELRRFLAGEPIHARPVGVVERTWRWVRRNPWPTAAIVASLFGLILTSVLLQSAVSARNKARDSRSQLFVAINELFNAWGDVTLLNEPALAGVRQQLLTAATNLYTDMGKTVGDDPELQQELGVSYYRLGKMMFHMEGYPEADDAVQSALNIQRLGELDAVTDEVGLSDLGETLTLGGSIKVKLGVLSEAGQGEDPLAAAVSLYAEAIRVRSRLVTLVPGEIEYQRQLLNSKMNQGTVLQMKGDLCANRGKLLEDEIAERESEGETDKAKLAALQADAQFARAEEYYRAAQALFDTVQLERKQLLALAPQDSSVRHDLLHDLAQGSFNLANITLWLGDFDSALLHIGNAIGDFEELLAGDSDNLQNQFDLARCQSLAGDIITEQIVEMPESDAAAALRKKRYAAAEQHFTHSMHILELLNSNSPAIVIRYRVALGRLFARIGDLHFLNTADDKARAFYETAVTLLQPILEAHPDATQISDYLKQAVGGLKLLDSFKEIEPANQPPAPDSTQPNDITVPEKQAES